MAYCSAPDRPELEAGGDLVGVYPGGAATGEMYTGGGGGCTGRIIAGGGWLSTSDLNPPRLMYRMKYESLLLLLL